jgi:CrcB protein
MSYLFVFIGGGLGAISRFLLAKLLATPNTHFPWATFTANVIACIIMGFLFSVLSDKTDNKYYLLLVTGYCGGFSTFSSFTAENLELLQSGHAALALLYSFLSVIICLLAIFVGYKFGNIGLS